MAPMLGQKLLPEGCEARKHELSEGPVDGVCFCGSRGLAREASFFVNGFVHLSRERGVAVIRCA